MSKKLTISFKETSHDVRLWIAIQSLEEKSHTIKEILFQHLCKEGEK